jgi:hypothetical protein
MARLHRMSLYAGARLFWPIVKAVRSRNLASISRWASEKCQCAVGRLQSCSGSGCISAPETCSDSSIIVAMVDTIETGFQRFNAGAGVVSKPAYKFELEQSKTSELALIIAWVLLDESALLSSVGRLDCRTSDAGSATAPNAMTSSVRAGGARST